MIQFIAVILTLLPTYQLRFQVFGIPMTVLEVMILALFVWWLVRRHTLIKLPRPLHILAHLFLLAAIIGVFVAPDTRAALGILKAYFIEPLLLVIVAWDTIKTKRDFEIILYGFAVAAWYISLYAIYQKITGAGIPGPWIAERRVVSVFPYPNAIGLFLAPLIPLFLSRKKIFFALTAIVAVVAIVFAKTEAALGVLALVLIVWLFFSNIRHAKIASITLALVGVIALCAIPSLSQKLFLRDWSGTVRRITWTETWAMLKDHPIFGAGLSGYPTIFRPYHHRPFEIFQYPHTLIFNFWTEMGALGVISFVSIAIWFYYEFFSHLATHRRDPFYLALGASMTVLLLHGLVDVPYFKNDLAVLFWILIISLPLYVRAPRTHTLDH